MALPEYSVKTTVKYQQSRNTDELVIEPGMFIRPIWNDRFVPQHHKETLLEANKARQGPWNGECFVTIEEKHVMCLFGTLWVPIPIDNIKVR